MTWHGAHWRRFSRRPLQGVFQIFDESREEYEPDFQHLRSLLSVPEYDAAAGPPSMPTTPTPRDNQTSSGPRRVASFGRGHGFHAFLGERVLYGEDTCADDACFGSGL